MQSIIKTGITALALTAGTVAASQAQPFPRLSSKGMPYAALNTQPKGEIKVRSQSDCPRTVIIRVLAKGQVERICYVR